MKKIIKNLLIAISSVIGVALLFSFIGGTISWIYEPTVDFGFIRFLYCLVAGLAILGSILWREGLK